MAQQIENQGQRIKVYTNHLHSPKRFLLASANKSYQDTTKRPGEVSRIKPRLQTELETTYNQEEKINGPKNQRTQLAHREKILPLH
jgi:hypothetical protein